jgi:hypothetical protein
MLSGLGIAEGFESLKLYAYETTKRAAVVHMLGS